MRNTIAHQLPLVETSIEHEHADELEQINTLLTEHPEIADLVHKDLVSGLKASSRGRSGMMSAEQVLRVLLIKQMNSFSYRILQFHLKDSRTYRRFCCFGVCDEIPSTATIQRDIKKLRPEMLEKINRILLGIAAASSIEKGRKVRVDCTVVESNIHAPTDSTLLRDCVRVLCRHTQRAKEQFGIQVSDHSRSARKLALSVLNAKSEECRTQCYKRLIKVTQKVVDDCKHVQLFLEKIKTGAPERLIDATAIHEELKHYLPLAEQVLNQTIRRVLNGEKLAPSEKLVSIFEPHTDIIIKDRRETYYGHKIVITNGESGLFTDLVIEKGNPADSTLAEKMISRQNDIYGQMPRQASFDGGFTSQNNLTEIKALGVSDVAFAKKRGLEVDDMVKSTWVYKRLRDFRAGIEAMISFLKRCFGLGRCNWRGFQSFEAYTWASVLSANLLLFARRLLE